jgi:hypothetical protein
MVLVNDVRDLSANSEYVRSIWYRVPYFMRPVSALPFGMVGRFAQTYQISDNKCGESGHRSVPWSSGHRQAKADRTLTVAMSTQSSAVSLGVSLQYSLGVAAAVVATLVMDAAMARLPEGETPPFVAAGVLTERPPDAAPVRLAAVVHYLAGGLTGPLFVWLSLTAAALFGPSLVTTLLAALVLYVLMVGFFAVVVLPRSLVARDRVAAIRRDWAVAAAAYLVVLVPVVTLVGWTL